MNAIAERRKAHKITKIKYNIFINIVKKIGENMENLNRKLEFISNNIMNIIESNNKICEINILIYSFNDILETTKKISSLENGSYEWMA